MKKIHQLMLGIFVLLAMPVMALAQQYPAPQTFNATNITQTSAVLSGQSSGSGVLESYIEINTGNATYVKVGSRSGAGSFSGTATGLRCNTTYFYLSVVRYAQGEIAGPEMSFRTLACDTQPQNVRIINFTASPTYLSNPGNTTLFWSSENASSCSVSSLGTVGTNGSRSQYVGSTQSFTLTCNGSNGGSDTRTVTVQVDNNSNFQINSFTASPTYLSNPGNTIFYWSTTGASSCSLSGLGNVNTNGSQSVYVGNSQSYTLNCTGTNGRTDSRSVFVQVDNNNNNPVRIDSFYASPTTVSNGGYTTIYWSTSNASYCTLNGTNVSTNSSRSAGPFFGSQNQSLMCYGVNGGSDSRTLFITTNGQSDGPIISNFNGFVVDNGYVNLTWLSNADYCVAGGSWSGNKSASGNERVGPFSGSRTFTLTCYRNGQTAYQTQTVFVSGTQQNESNSAVTNIATRIGTSGAQLNGIAVIANSQYSEGWFEYGRTGSLGNVTTARAIGTSRTVDFSEVITGLSSNSTYYYRAVMRNAQGVFRGDIERFATARAGSGVTNPTPVTPTQSALTYSRPAFMEVTVSQVTLDAIREGEVEYQVTYRSLTDRTLSNTVIKVLLPEEFEYISATRGVYSAENKTLTLNVGELRSGEQGSINLRAKVLPNAQVGKTVVVTGYANYTVPADSRFLAYQDEVVAYALTVIRDGSLTGQAAAAGLFAGDLGTIVGWLLLLLVLLAIIYTIRKLYLSFAESKKA